MTRLRLAIATLCFSVSLGVAAAGQQAGKPAADFSLPDAAQKTVRLSDLRGKVVSLPKRADVPHPINEQLIVELCSR